MTIPKKTRHVVKSTRSNLFFLLPKRLQHIEHLKHSGWNILVLALITISDLRNTRLQAEHRVLYNLKFRFYSILIRTRFVSFSDFCVTYRNCAQQQCNIYGACGHFVSNNIPDIFRIFILILFYNNIEYIINFNVFVI